MEDNKDQSLVLVTAIVESSAADMSFDLVGKHNAETEDAWCRRAPSSLFCEFSLVARPFNDGNLALDELAGGCAERWYRLIRSSVLPLAKMTF